MKNYLIGLLKEERTVLSDKELSIQEALLSSEKRLIEDTKYFLDYVEREKELLKEKESEIMGITGRNKALTDRLNDLKKERKTLIDDSERCIKNITNLKAISEFVHKLLGLKNNINQENHSKNNSLSKGKVEKDNSDNSENNVDNSDDENENKNRSKDKDNKSNKGVLFPNINHHSNVNSNFNNQSGSNANGIGITNGTVKNFDSKEKLIEKMSQEILFEFKSMNFNSSKNKEILSDYKRLITKFTETEEKILKLMEKKEENEKDYSRLKDKHFHELKILEEHEKSVIYEKIKLKSELNKDEKSLSQLKGQSMDASEIKKHTKLIVELYRESVSLDQPRKKIIDNNHIKPLMEFLKDKENKIREHIYILESYPKEIVEVFVEKRKFINKETTRNQVRQKKELENEIRNRNARERMNRVVIKGRNIMTHFKPKEDKVVKKETIQRQINQNNILYYDSD